MSQPLNRDTLVRALALELVGRLMRGEDRSVALIGDDEGGRTWETLSEPGPDEHRLEHLTAEMRELVARERPEALGVATTVRDPLDGQETMTVWAASADGATLALRVRTLVLCEGVLAPGNVEPLDELQATFARQLADTVARPGAA